MYLFIYYLLTYFHPDFSLPPLLSLTYPSPPFFPLLLREGVSPPGLPTVSGTLKSLWDDAYPILLGHDKAAQLVQWDPNGGIRV